MNKSIFSSENRTICDLLRQTRESAGLTQVALAKKLKETQSAVSKAERGERRLDLVQLKLFCRACGRSLADFVRDFEEATSRPR